MIKRTINSYLSAMKHRSALLSMFEDATSFEIFGMQVLRKNDMIFSIFENEEIFKKSYFSFIRHQGTVLYGSCVGKILAHSKEITLLRVENNGEKLEASSIFSEEKIDLTRFSVFIGSDSTVLDTSLFCSFYLNGKNCNNKSFLVLVDGYSLFFLQRKKFFCLCGIKL